MRVLNVVAGASGTGFEAQRRRAVEAGGDIEPGKRGVYANGVAMFGGLRAAGGDDGDQAEAGEGGASVREASDRLASRVAGAHERLELVTEAARDACRLGHQPRVGHDTEGDETVVAEDAHAEPQPPRLRHPEHHVAYR